MMNLLVGWAKRYWPYALVTLLILGPLLAPGYIITMDMVFVPHPPIPSEVNASYPLYVILHYVSYILPGDVLQKLLLGCIFLAAGIGMDRLLTQLLTRELSRWAIVAASLFYMTSAFVYERFMMGQWAVIAGYALLPFVITSLLRFLRQPSWRQLSLLVGGAVLLTILSVHALVPLFVAILAIVGIERPRLRQIGPKVAVGLFAFLAISSYWLVPAFIGSNTIGSALKGDVMDSHAFASQGGLFSLLRLQGMWAEGYDLFRLPQEIIPLPGVWQTLVWILVIVGLVVSWRKQRKIAVLGTGFIVMGCAVALIGIGGAYREPHKIMIITAIGMSLLLAVGIQAWLNRTKASLHVPVGVFACTVVMILGSPMLWGFSGQLQTRDYPPEWYTLNQRLSKLPDDKPAIFLPWHLYQRYSFSPRIVANPAATFFEGRRIIVSDDPEFRGVLPLKNGSLTHEVDRILKTRSPDDIKQLRQLGIGYVIFAREPGFEDDEILRRSDGLRKLFDEGRLTLYAIGEAT